jgi:aspartyl protease family protein
MLRLALLALFGAVSAVGAAQAVSAFDPARHDPQLRPEAAIEAAEPTAATVASIAKSQDGHYWAEADVNGRRVRFLVDTGASAVALTPADAKRLGFEPQSLSYDYKVTTAAGPARAAAVKLKRVSVAGATVADVDALVIEDGLDTSLLGMTYLGRLSRFEATRTALILRP